jgi:2-haloacid dehalogenase
MRPVLVFDVIETLVDLRALDEAFVDGFGNAGARAEWFDRLLHLTFTATITQRFAPFDELAAQALRIVEARRETRVSDMTRRRILCGLEELPPHPDVTPALERLADAGFLMHALSNGTQEATVTLLRNARLHRYFVSVQSAELSEAYKPKAQVYRNALARIDASPTGVFYVTAHDWDLAGALAFGMHGAFVARDGAVLDPAAHRPGIVAADVGGVAEALIFFPVTSASR